MFFPHWNLCPALIRSGIHAMSILFSQMCCFGSDKRNPSVLRFLSIVPLSSISTTLHPCTMKKFVLLMGFATALLLIDGPTTLTPTKSREAFRSLFWENQDVFNQCTLNTYSVAGDGTRICFHAVVTNADDTTPTATPSGGNGNESNSPTGTPSPSESSSGIGLGPNSWIQEAAMLGIYVVLVMLM